MHRAASLAMRQRNETRKARGRCSLKQVVHHSAKLPALEARVFRALSHLSPMLRRKAWESASRLIIDCDKCDWPAQLAEFASARLRQQSLRPHLGNGGRLRFEDHLALLCRLQCYGLQPLCSPSSQSLQRQPIFGSEHL